MIEIGKRLKFAIKNSNFSQKEIANMINTSENSLSAYMQGKASITAETLRDICNIINVPIQDIVYGVNEDDFNEMFIRKFNKLSDDHKKIVLANIDFLESQSSQKSLASDIIKDVKTSNKNTG